MIDLYPQAVQPPTEAVPGSGGVQDWSCIPWAFGSDESIAAVESEHVGWNEGLARVPLPWCGESPTDQACFETCPRKNIRPQRACICLRAKYFHDACGVVV